MSHKPYTHCRKCGAPITDIEIHKAAELCPKCRIEARRDAFYRVSSKALPFLNRYLSERDWPMYVRPRKIVDDCPEVYQELDVREGSSRIYWILSNALRQVETPNDEIYLPRSTTRRTFERTPRIPSEAPSIPLELKTPGESNSQGILDG